MAIAVKQIAGSGGGAAAAITPTLSSAAVAGNILVAISAQANARNNTTINDASYDLPITDGTALSGSANMGWLVAAKVAAGGETSFTAPADASQGNHTAVLLEIEGFTGSATLDDSAADTSNCGTVVTSQGTGTATASAAGFALAIFLSDNWPNVDGGRAYSDSFSEEVSYPGNSRPGILVASKTVSAGSVSCTFSTTDSGDEMVGCILVLVDDAGGGGGGFQAAWARNSNTLIVAGQKF